MQLKHTALFQYNKLLPRTLYSATIVRIFGLASFKTSQRSALSASVSKRSRLRMGKCQPQLTLCRIATDLVMRTTASSIEDGLKLNI